MAEGPVTVVEQPFGRGPHTPNILLPSSATTQEEAGRSCSQLWGRNITVIIVIKPLLITQLTVETI